MSEQQQLTVLGLTDECTEAAIFLALGAASACWDNLHGAGVFDSTRARRIGDELIVHLRLLRLLPDPVGDRGQQT